MFEQAQAWCCAFAILVELTVKAAGPFGMTGDAIPFDGDIDNQAVLVAIRADPLNTEAVAAFFTLAPQLLARPAPKMRKTGAPRLIERELIHPCKHRDVAGPRVHNDRRDQAVGVKPWCEPVGFFDGFVICRSAW